MTRLTLVGPADPEPVDGLRLQIEHLATVAAHFTAADPDSETQAAARREMLDTINIVRSWLLHPSTSPGGAA